MTTDLQNSASHLAPNVTGEVMRNRHVAACLVALAIGFFSSQLSAQGCLALCRKAVPKARCAKRKTTRPSASSAVFSPAPTCALPPKSRQLLTTATSSAFCRSCPSARRQILTISCTFTAWTWRSRSPMCSSIFAPSAKRPISNAASNTSSGCRSRSFTFWRATTSIASRICAARRSISVQPARARA